MSCSSFEFRQKVNRSIDIKKCFMFAVKEEIYKIILTKKTALKSGSLFNWHMYQSNTSHQSLVDYADNSRYSIIILLILSLYDLHCLVYPV